MTPTPAEARLELLRSRTFIRGAETQLTKALTLLDQLTGAAPDPRDPGIWIGRRALDALPMEGADWDRLLFDARVNPGPANIADQDSNHDTYTMASALLAARVGDESLLTEATARLSAAVGTEGNVRWLAVGRNLGAYIIAADLLRGAGVTLPASVTAWLAAWPAKTLPENNPPNELVGWQPFYSGSNAGAQEGFAYTALAAYLGDRAMLERAWDTFRRFCGDPTAPDPLGINLKLGVSRGWAHDPENPTAIVPAGVTRDGRRLDGAIINDMSRSMNPYSWPPVWEVGTSQYPWVALEGLVPAAHILNRAGYPAWEVADRAVLRTLEYLWYLRVETGELRWFDGIRASECVQLVNQAYGTAFPVARTVGRGRTFGWTGFTHGGLA
jgi:hypothetical protein